MRPRALFLVLAGLVALAADGGTIASANPAAGCGTLFQITSPKPVNLTVVLGPKGVIVKGTACAVDKVFLFDHTGAERSFHRDNDVALDVTAGGRWRFNNRPIGDPSDPKHTIYTILAMRVSAACARAIEHGPEDRTSLPKGCPRFRGDPDVQSVQLLRV